MSNNQSKSIKWIIRLSIVAFIFSIIALCFSSFRMEPVTFDIDRYSFSIDVLSLLVTLLIGWQVINVISFEKRMKSIIQKELLDTSKTFNLKFLNAEAKLYYLTAASLLNQNTISAFTLLIHAIRLYLQGEDIKSCITILKIIIDTSNTVYNIRKKDFSTEVKKFIDGETFQNEILAIRADRLYPVLEHTIEDLIKCLNNISNEKQNLKTNI